MPSSAETESAAYGREIMWADDAAAAVSSLTHTHSLHLGHKDMRKHLTHFHPCSPRTHTLRWGWKQLDEAVCWSYSRALAIQAFCVQSVPSMGTATRPRAPGFNPQPPLPSPHNSNNNTPWYGMTDWLTGETWTWLLDSTFCTDERLQAHLVRLPIYSLYMMYIAHAHTHIWSMLRFQDVKIEVDEWNGHTKEERFVCVFFLYEWFSHTFILLSCLSILPSVQNYHSVT